MSAIEAPRLLPVSEAWAASPGEAGRRAGAGGGRATAEVSLVIPTFNERGNIAPLLDEIARALEGVAWEALFVDDSTDGTDSLIAALALRDRRVRLLHRAVNRGGLARAVVDGLAEVGGEYVCVIDADLQHPPATLRTMLGEARRSGADVVIASRYVPGGSAGGLAGPLRQLYSRGLKGLSKLSFPRRLAGITDPLGGFFLVRRTAVQGVALRPVGYKILLEILVRCPWRGAREVPYRFQPRRYEASKANLRQGLQFLRHLSTLVWDCSPLFAPFHPVARPATPHPAPAAPVEKALAGSL
jgi:dolichol-phosphate mannosyltransferase